MKLRAHGMAVERKPGWEVRIGRRSADGGEPGGRPRPVLHAATVPLPETRGDFGGGVTPLLTSDDVFVCLFEYEPEAVGTPLFATKGRPSVRPADFSPAQLQRTIPGQSGMQYFFSEGDRAFCLYVVLGSHARRAALVRKVNDVLATLDLDAGARS
ncbi:MAG TPA: hypothetical protein VM433_04010 [Mycobacteriales bacterium]|nr:hypothetical protein [Mycobacteriales bacterium]